MLYKIIGTALLILTGGYVSLSISRFERRRLGVLDAYISLIYYIKGQIDCYAMPLADILARADPTLIAACLGLEVRGYECETAERVVSAPLTVLLQESRLYLEPECERLLTTFTGELGTVHRAEQVARCDYYIEALTRERNKLADSLPARQRTCGTLAVCCSIALSLLLW